MRPTQWCTNLWERIRWVEEVLWSSSNGTSPRTILNETNEVYEVAPWTTDELRHEKIWMHTWNASWRKTRSMPSWKTKISRVQQIIEKMRMGKMSEWNKHEQTLESRCNQSSYWTRSAENSGADRSKKNHWITLCQDKEKSWLWRWLWYKMSLGYQRISRSGSGCVGKTKPNLVGRWSGCGSPADSVKRLVTGNCGCRRCISSRGRVPKKEWSTVSSAAQRWRAGGSIRFASGNKEMRVWVERRTSEMVAFYVQNVETMRHATRWTGSLRALVS